MASAPTTAWRSTTCVSPAPCRGVNAVHGGWTADELKAALKAAHAHDGLSVIHVPVYAGEHELAGLGAWGQWNVGNWCADVQRDWMEQDL